jgi:hypothetical protein
MLRECQQQAEQCRTRAERVSDQGVRALLVSMAQVWSKLAEEVERSQRSKAYARR